MMKIRKKGRGEREMTSRESDDARRALGEAREAEQETSDATREMATARTLATGASKRVRVDSMELMAHQNALHDREREREQESEASGSGGSGSSTTTLSAENSTNTSDSSESDFAEDDDDLDEQQQGGQHFFHHSSDLTDDQRVRAGAIRLIANQLLAQRLDEEDRAALAARGANGQQQQQVAAAAAPALFASRDAVHDMSPANLEARIEEVSHHGWGTSEEDMSRLHLCRSAKLAYCKTLLERSKGRENGQLATNERVALFQSAPCEPRRVKVYEMQNEQWIDRGTGGCTGRVDTTVFVTPKGGGGGGGGGAASGESRWKNFDSSLDDDEDEDESNTINMTGTIVVISELDKSTLLLSSKVLREELYQKQQDTLIVWTDTDGRDLALSFQEADGCHEIWDFIQEMQEVYILQQKFWSHRHLKQLAGLDHASSSSSPPRSGSLTLAGCYQVPNGSHLSFPDEPDLSSLEEIEQVIMIGSRTVPGRDRLASMIIRKGYLQKLIQLFSQAEGAAHEHLGDLRRLCNIVKGIIFINDSQVLEQICEDQHFIGIIGILEYDIEYGLLKANHREYLRNETQFKQVVPIDNAETLGKIHRVYRYQYLRDVVLVRMLDDGTNNMITTSIFYDHMDIAMDLQQNETFLTQLFALFDEPEASSAAHETRRMDACVFLQQFVTIAKSFNVPARSALFETLTSKGLFKVLEWGMRQVEMSSRRKALQEADQSGGADGTGKHAEHLDSGVETSLRNCMLDLLIATIDQDANLVRRHMMTQMADNSVSRAPLQGRRMSMNGGGTTDHLLPSLWQRIVHVLIADPDLGIKSQLTEVLRILLDSSVQPAQPIATETPTEPTNKTNDLTNAILSDSDSFVQLLYDGQGMSELFRPLIELSSDTNTKKTLQAQPLKLRKTHSALILNLCDLLCFIVKVHSFRSKHFVVMQLIPTKIAVLLKARERHLQLSALRFYRTCVGLNDDFFNKFIIRDKVLEPVLALALDIQAQARENLLQSACFDLFDNMRKVDNNALILHIAEIWGDWIRAKKRDRDVFDTLLKRAEALKSAAAMPMTSGQTLDSTSPIQSSNGWTRDRRHVNDDALEEERYFNADDADDDLISDVQKRSNGSVPVPHPSRSSRPSFLARGSGLVDYDDDDEGQEIGAKGAGGDKENLADLLGSDDNLPSSAFSDSSPPSSPIALDDSLAQSPSYAGKRRRNQDEFDDPAGDDGGDLLTAARQYKRVASGSGNSPLRTSTSSYDDYRQKLAEHSQRNHREGSPSSMRSSSSSSSISSTASARERRKTKNVFSSIGNALKKRFHSSHSLTNLAAGAKEDPHQEHRVEKSEGSTVDVISQSGAAKSEETDSPRGSLNDEGVSLGGHLVSTPKNAGTPMKRERSAPGFSFSLKKHSSKGDN